MYKSVVYHEDELLGEVEIYPEEKNGKKNMEVKEIRINHFSQPSERCPPLAVLHTIAASGICFKMESKTSQSQDKPLYLLHSSCIVENKTAVMMFGAEELHLVAMYSRDNDKQYPCFWGFIVAAGLYNSCLIMLNLRCLGIVFDLDETLVVANTSRSFEDKIEALQRKISSEVDPQRVAGMLAEVKRYQEDKLILKQYAENDQVIDNGEVITIQSEIVPPLSNYHQPISRPILRLYEKNIILTRINPQNRDTSVLVKLRPAWEDLRSYLTARGRKRFEVYVCTMAERDYALEMWRLLDPDSNLINPKELLDRIVCVKSGSKKSLFNVFQDGVCHPKMALVIDDRLKVWDENDQPRVHVVPAFAPYYAPNAEGNNAVPVLCVARNVACNVRGGFFKEFDEVLLQNISDISYEDGTIDIPSPPDVRNYLVSEDEYSVANGNKDMLTFDGTSDMEVERRLKDALLASSTINSADPRLSSLQLALASVSGAVALPPKQVSPPCFPNMHLPRVNSMIPIEPSLQSSPAREEGEVPESELDPDTRRRLLILQHGQDTRQDIKEHLASEPAFSARPPPLQQVAGGPPRAQSHGSWPPMEEEMSPKQLNRPARKEFPVDAEPMREKHRPNHPSFFPKIDSYIPPDRIPYDNQRLPREAFYRDDRARVSRRPSNYPAFSGEDIPMNQLSSRSRDNDIESGRSIWSETPVGALQEIAMKFGTKVEFKPGLVSGTDLLFSVEAWFVGEKIGEGIGKTRREAQLRAAEGSIKNLADIYISRCKADSTSANERNKFSSDNGSGKRTKLDYHGNFPKN